MVYYIYKVGYILPWYWCRCKRKWTLMDDDVIFPYSFTCINLLLPYIFCEAFVCHGAFCYVKLAYQISPNAVYFLECSHVCLVINIYDAKVKRWILISATRTSMVQWELYDRLTGAGAPLKQPKHEMAFKLIVMCWLTTPQSNNA